MPLPRITGSNHLRRASPAWTCAGILLAALLLSTPSPAGDVAAGWAAYRKGDFETAMRLWRPAAERGDIGAQSRLGWLHAKGKGVERDYEEAIRWYRMAAERGHRVSQLALVELHRERASNSAGDAAEAIRWLRSAAEQGFPPAQYQLGRMFRDGDGVEYDEREARRWLEAAAANRLTVAHEFLAFRARLRNYHLSNARFLDWPAGGPVLVRTPEEIRRGPRSPVSLAGPGEIHCDFHLRRNRCGNPKFRCFMMTGPVGDGGKYYDAFGNVQPEATEVLSPTVEGEVRPVLAAAGKPLTHRRVLPGSRPS